MAIHAREAAPPFDSAPSWVLDEYEPIRTIGAGSFATAYLCHIRGEPGRVVVKVPHADLIQGSRAETFRRRFSAEVRSLAAVNHPNLVRIRRAGITSSGLPAIAMDFAEGPSLEQFLSGGPALRGPDVLSLLEQLGSALHCVHNRGIVHRDVSPQNIVWQRRTDGTPRPVLLDFGVAAFLAEDESHALVGTPRYMAPERQFSAATERSDMYSLGAIGWWAFSGVQFRDGSTLDAALAGPRNDLLSRAVIAPMIQSLLEEDPLRRPTARELETLARAALRGPRTHAPAPRPRIAVLDGNAVTSAVVRTVCQSGGADVVRFESTNAFFGRRCRRPFDLVVVVGPVVDNPVVVQGLGMDVVQLQFASSKRQRNTNPHILRFPHEQSHLLARIEALSRSPAAWIRSIDNWLSAWRCVLDSTTQRCNHCDVEARRLGEQRALAGSKEPPRLARLLRALHEQGDLRAAQGLLGELHDATEYAVRHRAKDMANDEQ